MKLIKTTIGTLTISVGLALTGSGQSFLTNGLVSYYPFDGNANDAVGTNNGTVSGATLTTDRFGEANSAYYFNGFAKILAGDQSLPLGAAPRTVSLWVNLPQSVTNNPNELPFRYGVENVAGEGNWVNVVTGTGTPRALGCVIFDFYNSGPVSTNIIVFNAWQQIVCTLDTNSTASVYINGTLAGASTVNANTTSSGVLNIGDGSGTGQTESGVIGAIDDVRIYNRALSTNEVQQLYVYESGPRVDLIKIVQPSLSNLSLGTNYQLQVSTDLNTWTNSGAVFTATNTSEFYPQQFQVGDWNQLFFRLQVGP